MGSLWVHGKLMDVSHTITCKTYSRPIYFIRLLSADEALHNMGCSIVNKITIADKRLERIQIKIVDN